MRKKLFSIIALLLAVSGAWASDITVYFTNNKGWSSVKFYWFKGEGNEIVKNADWPGQDMTWAGVNDYGEWVYKATVPDDVTIIFSDGSAQTQNISGITDGTVYWCEGYDDKGHFNVGTGSLNLKTYYVVGSMTNWQTNSNYQLQPSADPGQYYIQGVTLSTGDAIKVYGEGSYYPGGSDNDYGISEDAVYDIYFRPTGNGGDDWYYHYFYVQKPMQYLREAENNSSIIQQLDRKPVNVTLTRTLQTGGWNTFCVPFNTAIPSGWTVKELTSASYNESGKVLSLGFGNAASIEAGTPYLVKVGNADVVDPTFNSVTIVNSTNTITIKDDQQHVVVSFVPVMSPENLAAGDKSVLFVSDGKHLTYPTDNGNINGFRAYFQLADGVASARAFTMSFDDDATAITTFMSDEPTTANGIYTLDGRRIEGQPTQKGVYIVNGKKTVIK